MRKFITIMSLVLALILPAPGMALPVTGLYSHQVEVANESDSERSRAFAEALEAVIVKVTGRQQWLQQPAIQRALDNAQSYVDAISYASETRQRPMNEEELAALRAAEAEAQQADGAIDANAEPEPPGEEEIPLVEYEQRLIEVNFAARLINDLLANNNIPVWDANRPSVLVWMALQDQTGARHLLTDESDPEIMTLMQEFAAERGLPVIFPLMDFEDRQNLPVDTLWALDEEALIDASTRYGADSILAARLHFTASGELVGLWEFIFQDRAETFDGFASDLQAYLFEPLDRVTNQLASYFAIVPETSGRAFVRLRVDGVDDLSAYSALMAYVSNLGLVESVSTTAVDGTRLELQLGLVGNTQQLFEQIALDRDLLPVDASVDLPGRIGSSGLPDNLSSNDSVLHYRWTR